MSPPPHLQHHHPLMAGLSPENYLNSNEENEDAKLKRYFQASYFQSLCFRLNSTGPLTDP